MKETLLKKIKKFEHAHVKSALIPLVDVSSLPTNATVFDAVKKIHTEGYSRLLVYEDNSDHIVGLVSFHDLFRATSGQDLLSVYMKKPFFVSEAVSLPQLLLKMRKEGISLAVVLDEFNQVSGIVTLEDVLEELVGEIADEMEDYYLLYKKISDTSYLLSGRMEIDEINDKLQWALPKKDYETLSGFIISEIHEIPQVGKTFKYENFKFTIREASEKNIKLVHVNILS
ncbi:MAG: CBS domain-containing protein [Deltaproteobacteria bacterium]|nr:CBS domain-containing protein [Deltaproteobacteria bacterium]